MMMGTISSHAIEKLLLSNILYCYCYISSCLRGSREREKKERRKFKKLFSVRLHYAVYWFVRSI